MWLHHVNSPSGTNPVSRSPEFSKPFPKASSFHVTAESGWKASRRASSASSRKWCVLCAAPSCCRDSSWAAVLMCCRCTNAALLLSSRCVAGRRIRHGTSARGRRSKLTAAGGAATPSATAQPQATPLPPLRPQALLRLHPRHTCCGGPAGSCLRAATSSSSMVRATARTRRSRRAHAEWSACERAGTWPRAAAATPRCC